MPTVLPAKRKNAAGKGVMTAIILETLRDVRLPFPQIVARVASKCPELELELTYGRAARVLVQMKRRDERWLRKVEQLGQVDFSRNCSMMLQARR